MPSDPEAIRRYLNDIRHHIRMAKGFISGMDYEAFRDDTRTVYAVTDQRILIVTTWWNKEVKSVSLKPLPEISLTEKADGSGTITFGPQLPYSRMMGGGWPGASKRAAPAFELIDRVRSVYEIIQASSNEADRGRRS